MIYKIYNFKNLVSISSSNLQNEITLLTTTGNNNFNFLNTDLNNLRNIYQLQIQIYNKLMIFYKIKLQI